MFQRRPGNRSNASARDAFAQCKERRDGAQGRVRRGADGSGPCARQGEDAKQVAILCGALRCSMCAVAVVASCKAEKAVWATGSSSVYTKMCAGVTVFVCQCNCVALRGRERQRRQFFQQLMYSLERLGLHATSFVSR
jgi:hypothetical protein